MIYANKSDGSYGQQKSFDQWIEKKYTPKIINNHPRLGFVINKGLLNKYHFGASAKFRVYHPEGYEFEISLENLSMLLAYTDTSCGEIKSPCTIGWQGTNVFLIPEVQNINTIVNIKYYDVTQVQQKAKNKLDKINNNGKALSKRVLTTGKIVENKSGQRFVICAPTSTQKKEDFPTIPLITTEILKDEKIFSIINPFYQNDGYNKIFKSYDEISKFFYPLNKIDNKLNADMMDDFVKILTKDDLTPSELNALKQLKETTVPFYSPNIKFESLNEELKEPEVFLSSIVKKYYQLMQKLDGNKEKIFFTNKVVEKNGVPYIIGFNFDYKLFKKHQYFDTTNVYRKASYVLNASKYCDSLSLFFMPLNKTMDNPYKEDDVTEQFSIYFDKETLKVIDDNFMNKEKIANLLKSKYYCFQSEKEKEEAEKDELFLNQQIFNFRRKDFPNIDELHKLYQLTEHIKKIDMNENDLAITLDNIENETRKRKKVFKENLIQKITNIFNCSLILSISLLIILFFTIKITMAAILAVMIFIVFFIIVMILENYNELVMKKKNYQKMLDNLKINKNFFYNVFDTDNIDFKIKIREILKIPKEIDPKKLLEIIENIQKIKKETFGS